MSLQPDQQLTLPFHSQTMAGPAEYSKLKKQRQQTEEKDGRPATPKPIQHGARKPSSDAGQKVKAPTQHYSIEGSPINVKALSKLSTAGYALASIKPNQSSRAQYEQMHPPSSAQQNSKNGIRTAQKNSAHEADAFDNTETPSMSTGSLRQDENVTAVLSPLPRQTAVMQESYQNDSDDDSGLGRDFLDDPSVITGRDVGKELVQMTADDSQPMWQNGSQSEVTTVKKKKSKFAEQHRTMPQPNRLNNAQTQFQRNQAERDSFDDTRELPHSMMEPLATPTRVKSAPLQDLPAPQPRRHVGFGSQLNIEYSDPAQASDNHADHVLTPGRPRSVGPQGFVSGQLKGQNHNHSMPRVIGVNREDDDHEQYILSAGVVNMHDQRAPTPTKTATRNVEAPNPFEPSAPQPPRINHTALEVPRKRSYDKINDLDYNETQLKAKTLTALQSEDFLKTPNGPTYEPAKDEHGQPLPLHSLLQDLDTLDKDSQARFFASQSDKQWSETGTWFVNTFADNLKKLQDLRANRRMLALQFEDKIRRRQAEIEIVGKSVDKELRELDDGGKQLIQGRKSVGAGSRTAHP
ncbi:hypothetical protein LTR66_017023 [Elasticomyces elasticus]|nr:hypothetical protein LTR66_017023 [Elasticomyces elasticus]